MDAVAPRSRAGAGHPRGPDDGGTGRTIRPAPDEDQRVEENRQRPADPLVILLELTPQMLAGPFYKTPKDYGLQAKLPRSEGAHV